MTRSTLVEQAVFTSARTASGDGYQLVASSPDISEEARRAIPAWCPTHDGLLAELAVPRSVSFFTLSTGEQCVSRTIVQGYEYSQRGAPRLVTHVLLVKEDVLARFSNDPFSLLRAVELSGRLAQVDELPGPHVAPIPLLGRSGVVQPSIFAELLHKLGAARLAIALEALLRARPLALRGDCPPELLMAGLLQMLPVECRSLFSFATGLNYSSRRPFDLVTLPGDASLQRHLAQRYQLETLDLSQPITLKLTPEGWASHVALCLARGGVDALAAELSIARPGLTPSDLPALAAALAQEAALELSAEASLAPGNENRSKLAHAHGAHRRHQKSAPDFTEPGKATADSSPLRNSLPSQQIAGTLAVGVTNSDHSSVLEKLGQLDDLVFDALAGKPAAMDKLQTLWPAMLAELPADLIEESREHYLHHAMHLWQTFVAQGRTPEKAIAALDVLTLLCGEWVS